MDPEKFLEAINEIVNGCRADMAKYSEEMTAKYDALDKKIDAAGSRRAAKDEDEYEDDMAQRVAADRRSDSVDPAAFASMWATVNELKKRQSRPMSDLNAYADVQEKADAVFNTHGERAEPPMAGEDIVSYNIRMHRKLQKYSPKWKGVELSIIAADRQAFENVLTEIRADAMQAGLNPVHLKPLEHRMITKTMPSGHTVNSFVGNGTIFKQMSRPVRHVAFIGTRSSAAHY